MKVNKILIAGALSAFVISGGVLADESSHGHDAESMPAKSMSHDSMESNTGQSQMFLEKKDIDGYTVSFHVMAAEEGMNHGGSHNLMIKVDQQGAAVKGVQMNSKVIYPDGTEESKPLMMMGDWQMAGYDLKDSGKHQLMVLFKTADGKKHFGGLYYGE
ncbi:MAG: hypothetical protein KBT66_10345 [Amphritea sp.]|nr:hypothetical protein [Amphritea sp.]